MKLFTSYRNKKFWQSIMLFLLLLNSAYSQTQADVNAVSAYIAANPNSAQAQQYNSYMQNYYGSIVFKPPSFVTYEGELLQQNLNQFYLQYGPPDIAAAAAAAAALAAAEAAVAPHPLPSGATGASNLLPRLGSTVSQGVISPLAYSFASSTQATQLLREYHYVNLGTATYTAAFYQNNYASCANGGSFIGPVTAISSQYLYYFCMLPVPNSYLISPNSPIYNGSSSTYVAEQKGFISWTNPNLPAGSGVTEQITTTPTYQNGYPLTTFMTTVCDPSTTAVMISWTSASAGTEIAYQTNGAVFQSVTMSITQGGNTWSNTSTSNPVYTWPQNTAKGSANICATYATVTAPIVPNQPATVTNTFSGLSGSGTTSWWGIGDKSTYSFTYSGSNGNLNFTNAYITSPFEASYCPNLASNSVLCPWSYNSHTCSASFSISTTQMGSTAPPLYLTCTSPGATITPSTTQPSLTDFGWPTW